MAEQAEHRPGRDVEVEVAQRPQLAEALAEALGATPGGSVRTPYLIVVQHTNRLAVHCTKWQAATAPTKNASTPIWTQPAPGTPAPKLTREQIADVALAIADSEGFEAVSMRRIAEELDVGTMTLYYYVRTKDDLLSLMDDALMARDASSHPTSSRPSGGQRSPRSRGRAATRSCATRGRCT